MASAATLATMALNATSLGLAPSPKGRNVFWFGPMSQTATAPAVHVTETAQQDEPLAGEATLASKSRAVESREGKHAADQCCEVGGDFTWRGGRLRPPTIVRAG